MEERWGEESEEVLRDLKLALERIDFKNGYIIDSQAFSDAMNLGLMWMVLCKIGSKMDSMAVMDAPKGESGKYWQIDNALANAKIFLQRYIESKDSSFKKMADDELSHVSILVKKAYAKLPSGDEKTALKEYELKMKEIMDQMESA